MASRAAFTLAASRTSIGWYVHAFAPAAFTCAQAFATSSDGAERPVSASVAPVAFARPFASFRPTPFAPPVRTMTDDAERVAAFAGAAMGSNDTATRPCFVKPTSVVRSPENSSSTRCCATSAAGSAGSTSMAFTSASLHSCASAWVKPMAPAWPSSSGAVPDSPKPPPSPVTVTKSSAFSAVRRCASCSSARVGAR